MKIGLFSRFSPGDHPDVPEGFLKAINIVLEDFANALSGNLTLQDNMRAEVIEIDLADSITTPIRMRQLDRNPIIGLLGAWDYTQEPEFNWSINQDRALTVDVTLSWTSPPSAPVRCVLVFLGGATVNRENS